MRLLDKYIIKVILILHVHVINLFSLNPLLLSKQLK